MTDRDTPTTLRAIATMMRMEGYRPDAAGVEAFILDNAANEIERLRKALKPFKEFADEYVSEGFHDTEPMEEAGGAFVWKNFRKVREALEGK